MKKLVWLTVVLIVIFSSFPAAYAQVRIPEKPEFEPKIKKERQKLFLFQIEPALSFPSATYKYESWWFRGSSDVNYDLSVAGANINFLPILVNKVISQDSSLVIEGRLRFTTGFWHFQAKKDEEWNLIPLEGGFDVGIAHRLSRGYKIIPYAGFQYGISFRNIREGATPKNDLMYNL